MKKSLFSIIVLVFMFVLISVSCQSTGETETKPVSEGPSSQAERPAGQTAGPDARVEEARKRAMDFESPAYFPSDWEALEARYAAARGESAAATRTALYNDIADAYDDLFRKTVPLYAQAREDEIIDIRDELISTGFTSSFPDYLYNADEIALEALDQYEAGNYYEAKDAAAKAQKEYETLMIGARIYLARQEIVDRGFWQYDHDNFDKADDVTINAMDEYEAGNKESAVTYAEEALLRYNLVLSNGWTAYSADRRNLAAAERDLALSERVNIASRDTFREGETLFNQASETFSSESYQNAAILFMDAEAIFAIARQETEEKRLRAIESIRLAEEKIEESNETAIEAERIIEGGSR